MEGCDSVARLHLSGLSSLFWSSAFCPAQQSLGAETLISSKTWKVSILTLVLAVMTLVQMAVL